MTRFISILPLLVFGACSAASSGASSKFEPVKAIYADQCAACHGATLQGGQAPSLVDSDWSFGESLAEITSNIRDGIPEVGMPGFGETLSEDELALMAAWIKSAPELEETDAIDDVPSVEDQVVVDDYITGLNEPWGFTFIDNQNVFITEKTGRFLLASQNGDLMEIADAPMVNSNGQGGLLDVAIDPEYADNGWVYLTYSHALKGTSGKSMTRLVRGRIVDNRWVDQQVLFEAHKEDYVDTKYHYGSRITFDDQGHVFFSIGDRGKQDHAQKLDRPNGKVHRLKRDGTVPEDNPFVGDADVYPSIYAYGIRNPQGLIRHPETGVIWETEHGPRGGDELNAISPGTNYGWPVISYGINYNGTELTPYKTMDGMAQPKSQWTPSIAVCGLDVYQGDLFPEWRGRLLAGALKYQTVRLIEVDGDQYVGEATLIKDKGRVRDVTTGPDGAIYVALPDKIVRLSPRP